MAPRETENNAYAKFWGDKQRALWYVMVFLEWSVAVYVRREEQYVQTLELLLLLLFFSFLKSFSTY